MGKPVKKNNKPIHTSANKNANENLSAGSHTPKIKTTSPNVPAKLAIHTIPPPSWPAHLPYLHTPLPHPSLAELHHEFWHPLALPHSAPYVITNLATYTPSTNPLIQIRQITDPSHPAYPQHGLFAARNLAPGTHIVDYTGLLHVCPLPATAHEISSKDIADSPCSISDYDLAFLDRDASMAIDGTTMGNESRFVNDWRGIREDGPNAMFEEYFVKVKVKNKECWEARMGIWALPAKAANKRAKSNVTPKFGIEKGEEICVSYGKGWWRARRGAMEEWEEDAQE